MHEKVRALHPAATARQPDPSLPRLPAAHIHRPRLTQALLAGAHDLTVSPALLTQYLANAQTAQAVAEFASYG